MASHEHDSVNLVQVVADRASRHPDRVAIRYLGDGEAVTATLTYGELHRGACRVANLLKSKIRPGEPALLVYPGGPSFIAAFMGCLYAGVVAIPAFPPESTQSHHLRRLSGIVRDARTRWLLTNRDFLGLLGPALQVMPELGALEPIVTDGELPPPAGWQAPELAPQSLAFLQYTSGSTARPKGVMVGHGNLVANEAAIQAAFEMMEADVVVSWLPLFHDMGLVGGLLQTLFSGASLVLLSPEHFIERPVRWLQAVSRFRGTVSGAPDFAFRLCAERVTDAAVRELDLASWRVAFCGAEPVREATLRQFAVRFAPAGFQSSALFPCYGLAEATLFVAGGNAGRGATTRAFDPEALSAGRGVAASGGHVLAGCGRPRGAHAVIIAEPESTSPVPAGTVGEILVTGPSIALGYWKDDAATRETFVSIDGQRTLRTGDLGFELDGELFITGRRKDLLIVRGRNVYPQDIEAAVEERCEVVRRGRVAAFSVENDGHEGIGVAAEISRRLQKLIRPEAVCAELSDVVAQTAGEPAAWVALLNPGAIPMTSSGKLQRAACAVSAARNTLDAFAVWRNGALVAAQAGPPAAEAVPTLSETGARLAAIWKQTLRVPEVRPDDSFFSLGGNSLRAVEMMAAVSQVFGVTLDARVLFEAPTLSGLAQRIEQAAQTPSRRPSQVPRTPRLPLSRYEERLWSAWLSEPTSVAYNVACVLRMTGKLETEPLAQALSQLVARHEVLRTRYLHEDGRPYRTIEASRATALPVVDLSDVPVAEREQRWQGVVVGEVTRPFDLATGAFRVLLVHNEPNRHDLVIAMHHIVVDGHSAQTLLDELVKLYAAERGHQAANLQALEFQYADYAAWEQRQPAADATEAHLDTIERVPGIAAPLLLPTDQPRPLNPSHQACRVRLGLDEPTSERVRAFAEARHVTPFVVMHAAFQAILARYCTRERFCVGVPSDLRTHPMFAGLVGFLVDTLPVAADLSGAPSFSALVSRVQTSLLRAQALRAVPVERVLAALDPNAERSDTLRVTHNHLSAPPARMLGEVAGVRFENLGQVHDTCPFELTLETAESGGRLEAALLGERDAFSPAFLEQLGRHYLTLLAAAVASPHAAVEQLNFLSALEEAELWADGTPVRSVDAEWRSLGRGVEEQAAVTPDAVALVCGADAVSYGALNARANQLAHYLRRRSVGPEVLVGVALEPSIELGIALLAIIKAGGAYLPIDTEQPQMRLEAILNDGRPLCVVTREAERGRLDALGVETVGVEEAWSAASRESERNLDVAPSGDHPAYCLYTSGSTGVPKGVVVPHAAAQNHMSWMQRAFPLAADDVVLQRTHLGFDAAVWEFWLPLLAGARCVMLPRQLGRDPAALIEALPRLGVTVLQLVPSLLRAMLTQHGAAPALGELRWLFCGGEALPIDLVRQIRGSVRLVNLYGPTEATIDATSFECATLDPATVSVPIGKPIANTAGYVLDGCLRPVPRGVTGELFLGGSCLARGYLNRPELTAERFVPSPASGTGDRLYRTGDRVRRRGRGELEFVGRSDGQVKLRGVRIELGEIEAGLRALPSVREAAVVVDEAHLTGYIVPEPGEEGAGGADFEAELVRRLSERLPESMVPRAFVFLPKLPLTANCKLDRQALASMRPPRASAAYVAPRNAAEQALAAVFARVLGVERVGAGDDFFALGGDSIVAMQVVSEGRRLGIGIEAKDVFQHATVAALAQQVRSVETTSPRATPPVGDVPLTPIQSWFFERDFLEARHWHQRLWLESTDGVLDPVTLGKAVSAVVDHHDVFRLRFQREPRGWRQSYAASAVEHSLQRVERLPHESLDDALVRARELAVGAVDFEHGPLMAVVQLDLEHCSRLLVVVHHLVVDAVSLRILVEDLGQAYRDLLESRPVALPPAVASYQDWANALVEYARSTDLQEQLPVWREVVSKQDGPWLPVVEASDEPRSLRAVLDHAPTARLLYEASDRWGARPHEVVMTAFAAALCRVTQREDVVVVVEGHGRAGTAIELDVTRTVGWFTARYPVHLVPDVNDLPSAVRDTGARLAWIPDEGIGYGALRYLSAGGSGLSTREPRVTFNYLGTLHETAGAQAPFRLVDEPSGSRLDERAGAGDWLEVLAWIRGGRLHLKARLGAALESAAVERVLAECVEQLGAMLDDPRSREVSLAGDVEDVYPLTPVQEGILYHGLLAPDSRVYVNQRACTLRTPLDVERLRQAWNRVAARHEPLRTRFVWEGLPRPLQVVGRHIEVPFEIDDFSALPPDEREGAIAAYLERDRERGFDLTSAPLLRVGVVRLESACFLLRWTEHHLLFDGWSSTRLVSEVLREYAAPGSGAAATEACQARYRDYVEWLLNRNPTQAREFWATALEGLEASTLLAEHVPKSTARGRGFLRLSLGSSVDARARDFARRHRLTLNTLLQASVALAIGQYVRSRDIVFGVTTSGRDAGGLELGLGLFLHTLPLRTRIEPQRSVVDWLQALQRSNLTMREHETLPLAEIQRISSVPPGQALFDVLFVFENYPADADLEQAKSTLGASDLRSWESTNYPLTLTVFPTPELSIELTYDKAVFSESVVLAFAQGVERALMAVSHENDRRVRDVLPLVKGDSHGLYRRWNATGRPYPAECIHGAFEAQARRTPEATAVAFEGRTLSYAELNQRANAVASALQRAGVGVDDVVGVCAERCLELVPCLLGVLKAGAGYLPLDPDLPRERLEGMLEETRAQVVLAGAAQRQVFGVRAWSLEKTVRGLGSALSPSAVAPSNVACCLYTSGSTGRPKGVLSTQGGLWNRLCWMQERYPLGPDDVVLQKTPFGFDVSVWEFFWPLITGARLVLLPPGAHRDPGTTAAVIQREAVTVLHFVPSMLHAFIGAAVLAGCHSIRRVVCSGEVLSAELVERFMREHPAKLCNLYGPTEASIDVSAWECTPAPEGSSAPVPIGTAIANTQLYVVDGDMALVPAGQIGELCIAGVALARGYVGRPELSAERFVPNPFGDATGGRLYRTGDLVRVASDGVLEFLGRDDQQVKIRGCRIELGEIEAQLTSLPEVREAVVVARRQAGGEPDLWAYLVLCADAAVEGAGAAQRQLESAWIARLRRVLPEYMIPQGWVLLERLPRTSSGKLDRGQLPLASIRAAGRGEPLNTETERRLAAIWRELLGCESVSRTDDFMGLGGHSLLVTRLTTRLRTEFGVDISLRALFDARTLAAMAELIERAPARPLVAEQLEQMSALLESLEQDS